MPDDNNPFRPALNKPADDSVLATDPVADNFLADSNQQPVRATLDQLTEQPSNLNTVDQPIMDTPLDSSPIFNDQPLGNDAPSADLNNFGGNTAIPDPLDVAAAAPAAASNNLFENLSTSDVNDQPKKKGLSLGLGKKSKKTNNESPANPFAGDSINLDTSANSDLMSDDSLSTNGLAGDNISLLDESNSAVNIDTTQGATESTNDNPDIANAIARAADATATTAPAGQSKQFTVSILTMVFGVLFIISTSLAIWFFIDKSNISNQLNDASAELQSLKDKETSATNSNNKTSTQFDSLQTKIKELTKSNEDKQKTLDENKKTIDELTKAKADLSTQLTTAQNKINSDKQVSDGMKSLVTAICANNKNELASASVCVSQQANTNNQNQGQ